MIVKALKVSDGDNDIVNDSDGDNDIINDSDGDNSMIVIVVLITRIPLHFQNSQQSNQD